VPSQNAADLQTKGMELTIGFNDSYNVGSKPLSFNAKLILSDSRSRITRFKNDQELFSSFRKGQELGEIWGLTNDGLFKNADEISKLDETDIVPWGALAIVPGLAEIQGSRWRRTHYAGPFQKRSQGPFGDRKYDAALSHWPQFECGLERV
jgi:hypothetical protein